MVIVDATIVGIERPIRNQKDYYSGKHKRHGVKIQIIADYFAKTVVSLAFTTGRVHDLELFRRSKAIIADDILIAGDLGYHGLHERANFVIPNKKPKGKEFTEDQKNENKIISSARIFIEHVISFFKRFKILGSRYRNRRRRVSIRAHLIASIYNALHG